jgi:hypothetical protein
MPVTLTIGHQFSLVLSGDFQKDVAGSSGLDTGELKEVTNSSVRDKLVAIGLVRRTGARPLL